MLKTKFVGYLLIGILVVSGAAYLSSKSKKETVPPKKVSQEVSKKPSEANQAAGENLLEQFHAIPFKKTKLENYKEITNLCELLPVEQIKNIYSQPVVKVYPKVIPGAKWCKIDYADGLTLTVEYQKGVTFITPLNRLKNKADAHSEKNFPLRNLIIDDKTDNEQAVYLQVSSNGNLISISFEKPNEIHLTGHLEVLKEVAKTIGESILE